jgi:hypothetical protein
MNDSTAQKGSTSDTSTAILLGGVLGLVFSSVLVAAVCGWQVWVAQVPQANSAAATSGSPARVPPPSATAYPSQTVYGSSSSYAAPASSYPSTSGYYSTDDVQYYAPGAQFDVPAEPSDTETTIESVPATALPPADDSALGPAQETDSSEDD